MKNNWPARKLEDVCEVFADGDWIERKDQSTSGIRLIQTGNIGNGHFLNRDTKARYISESTFNRLKCAEVMPGDCLLSRLPDPVGRAALIPDVGQKMITAVDCTIMRFKKDLLPQWFIYYSLSPEYQSEINKAVTGATRQRISKSNLGSVKIPVPSVSDQKRLISIFDGVFEKTIKAKESAEKNLQNARELFESYLQNIFARVGEGWEEKRIEEICENLDSKRVPVTKRDRREGKYPYYGASGIVDYVSEYIFDEDLLLVSEDGANLLARTYPIAFSIKGKTWVNNHAHVLRFEDMASQKFVEYYLNSIKLDEYVSGMAQPKLNQTMLNSIVIPFPKLYIQRKIVADLDMLSTETKKLETIYQQKLADLEELKKSVLHKAFNGELAGACS